MIRVYLEIGAVVAFFAAGWFANGWRHDAQDEKKTADTLLELQGRMEDQVKALETFNSSTAEEEKKVIASMRRTQVELRGIRDEISSSNVGACRITDNGDRLRADTYRSAIPARDSP